MNDHIKIKIDEHPTEKDVLEFMKHMYDTGDDAFLYLPKGLEMDWKSLCVEANVRNWLFQRKKYFGW